MHCRVKIRSKSDQYFSSYRLFHDSKVWISCWSQRHCNKLMTKVNKLLRLPISILYSLCRHRHTHRHTGLNTILCFATLLVHSIESKVVLFSIMSVGHRADPGFLAVSPQVTLVTNPVVGCRYFLPGLWLLSQPMRSTPWPLPHYTAWWQRHTGVSSMPKATLQWCPARARTHDLWIACAEYRY